MGRFLSKFNVDNRMILQFIFHASQNKITISPFFFPREKFHQNFNIKHDFLIFFHHPLKAWGILNNKNILIEFLNGVLKFSF
jgi:hypothetical protein